VEAGSPAPARPREEKFGWNPSPGKPGRGSRRPGFRQWARGAGPAAWRPGGCSVAASVPRLAHPEPVGRKRPELSSDGNVRCRRSLGPATPADGPSARHRAAVSATSLLAAARPRARRHGVIANQTAGPIGVGRQLSQERRNEWGAHTFAVDLVGLVLKLLRPRPRSPASADRPPADGRAWSNISKRERPCGRRWGPGHGPTPASARPSSRWRRDYSTRGAEIEDPREQRASSPVGPRSVIPVHVGLPTYRGNIFRRAHGRDPEHLTWTSLN